jgi:hypothetical protein
VPGWLRPAHRASGTLAFLLTVLVAYHCLWALGFQAHSGTRVLAHGVAGCFFFGALTSKVLIVRSGRMPRWALPVVGGTLFAALTVIWLSSSLWFFKRRVPGDLSMAGWRVFNTAILIVLIAGALLFVLLLAGVGSGLLTNPKV